MAKVSCNKRGSASRQIHVDIQLDVNDLHLDSFCAELAKEIDTLMSTPAPKYGSSIDNSAHLGKPLWPLSHADYDAWRTKSEDDIRNALRTKVLVSKGQDTPE